MQKTIATTLSVAASLMLIAGTLAPVAFGAATTSTGADKCTLRSTLTYDEVWRLAPKDPGIGGDPSWLGNGADSPATAGKVLGDTGTPGADYSTPNWGILCTYSVVKQITSILFLIVGILSVAAIVFAAFLYLTAAQNPAKTKEAHNALIFAIIGIVVAIAARIIPAIALGLIGVGH